MQENLMNNKKFFKFTHTDMTKQGLRESSDIKSLVSELPDSFSKIYVNKTIMKNKRELASLRLNQYRRGETERNKKSIGFI